MAIALLFLLSSCKKKTIVICIHRSKIVCALHATILFVLAMVSPTEMNAMLFAVV
jgi:hypothetical protein